VNTGSPWLFAALIVGGGSSEYAVRMVKGMLGGLPPDYLS